MSVRPFFSFLLLGLLGPTTLCAGTLITDFVEICAQNELDIESARAEATSRNYKASISLSPETNFISRAQNDLRKLTGGEYTLVKHFATRRTFGVIGFGSSSPIFPDVSSVCALVVFGDNSRTAQGDLVKSLFLGSPVKTSTTPDRFSLLWEIEKGSHTTYIRFSTSPNSQIDGYSVALFTYN